MSKTTAQVAVEAIISAPYTYDTDIMRVVLADGIAHGVHDFYTNMLADILNDRED